jgi:hypothetical protein
MGSQPILRAKELIAGAHIDTVLHRFHHATISADAAGFSSRILQQLVDASAHLH